MKNRILVLDDDGEMRRLLCDYIRQCGFDCEEAVNGERALGMLQDENFDILVTDLKMEGMNGMDVLRAAKRIRPSLPVVMITAFGSIENAIEAMKEGAYHYITKPFKMAEISILLKKAIEDRNLRQENANLRQVVETTFRFENILGQSKPMQQIFSTIQRLSSNTSNVLINGESGTGKELVAKAIHYNSPLKKGPFVAINCSAIPEGLLESELFGHAKGAFTGAIASQKGLFEEADGGTLFLDEIGDLPIVLQSKLLRVLQDQVVRPVGSRIEKKINVRIISATHKDLDKSIQNKEFREDLYYRLNVIPIKLPKLTDRLDDIPVLAKYFIEKHAHKSGLKVKGIAPEAINLLMQHSWPGNVRELENIMERAMAFSQNEFLEPADIPLTLKENRSELVYRGLGKMMTLEELEMEYIQKVLKETKGQKDRAAKILGINRRTLYRMGERYGINLDAEHYSS